MIAVKSVHSDGVCHRPKQLTDPPSVAPLSGGTRFLFRSSIHVDQFNRPVKRVREREREG